MYFIISHLKKVTVLILEKMLKIWAITDMDLPDAVF